jgi:hypothetical protein
MRSFLLAAVWARDNVGLLTSAAPAAAKKALRLNIALFLANGTRVRATLDQIDCSPMP